MPFPNEHSCRLLEPGQFVRFFRKTVKDSNDIGDYKATGKSYDLLIGYRKDGSSDVQTHRYPKDTWTAEEAGKHCRAHKGSFEAAKHLQAMAVKGVKFKICGYELQEMASEEVLRSVSALDYRRIMKADPRACFRAYVIGHEGESSGKVVGMGRVIKKWAHSAVENINKKLAIGTKIFHMHGPTNEHDGRNPIGEIVGKTLSDIAGRLSSIAIAYIFPEFRDIPLDIASIEGDIIMPETINPNARAVDVDVEEITAIALGNSQINKPGFAGATLLASLQEFADNADYEKPPKEGEKPMTKDEIRQAIRDGKFKPSDLFGSAEMSDDPIVQEVIREKRRNEEGFEGRQSEKLRADVAKAEQEKKDLQAKLETLGKANLKTRASEAVKPAVEKRKLDEKQSAFILKRADKFEPKSEESLAGDLDRFLDAQLDELKGFAEIYGIKAGAAGTAGVGAGRAADTSIDDLLTPDALKDEIKK
jgi:hypothetical protein